MTDPFGRYRLSQNILRNRQREAERETVRMFQAATSEEIIKILANNECQYFGPMVEETRH